MSDLIDRQDAIDEIRFYITEPDISDDETKIEGYNDGLEMAISILSILSSAEPEWKWIPVTERLPKKENKSYWICTDTKHQCECRWTNNIYGIGKSNNWGWSIFDIPQYTKVIAWMPLPEPWRGDK